MVKYRKELAYMHTSVTRYNERHWLGCELLPVKLIYPLILMGRFQKSYSILEMINHRWYSTLRAKYSTDTK